MVDRLLQLRVQHRVVRVSVDRERFLATLNLRDVFEHQLQEQRDPSVGKAEVLDRTVDNLALGRPHGLILRGDSVEIHARVRVKYVFG